MIKRTGQTASYYFMLHSGHLQNVVTFKFLLA